jgi:hypothetical protein
MRVPTPLQALMAVLVATWWQMAVIRLETLNFAMEVFVGGSNLVDQELLHRGFPPSILIEGVMNKVAGCTVSYVLAYLFLPAIVQRTVSWGPHRVRNERILGLICWGLFIFIINIKLPSVMENEYLYVTTSGLRSSGWSHLQVGDSESQLVCIIPVGIPKDFVILGVLGAANAYLPIELPDAVVNSLLGALLLMPITMTEPAQQLIVYMTPISSSVVQLCGLFACFMIYLGFLAPLFQAAAMKIIGETISNAKLMVTSSSS